MLITAFGHLYSASHLFWWSLVLYVVTFLLGCLPLLFIFHFGLVAFGPLLGAYLPFLLRSFPQRCGPSLLLWGLVCHKVLSLPQSIDYLTSGLSARLLLQSGQLYRLLRTCGLSRGTFLYWVCIQFTIS